MRGPLPGCLAIAFLVVVMAAPVSMGALSIHPPAGTSPARSLVSGPTGRTPSPPPGGAPPSFGPWVNLTHNATPAPAPRSSTATAYDPLLDELVLFGGYNATPSGPYGDTWTFAGGNWTDITSSLTTAPPPMWGSEMTYDPALHGIVLFGGRDSYTAYNATWLFNATGWWNISGSVAPSPRIGVTMDYDPVDGYLLAFGGLDPVPFFTYYNDTWKFTASGWSKIAPTGGVAPPAMGEGAWDARDGYFVTFGGGGSCGSPSTWTYVGGTWTNRTSTSGTPPPFPGGSFSVAYDPLNSSVIAFGGNYGSPNCGSPSNETWEYSTGRWANLTPGLSVSPIVRCCGQLAYDPTEDGVVLFGGNGYLSFPARLNDTWVFEGRSGVQFSVTPGSIDAGQTIACNATESTLTGPLTWNWSFGDGAQALDSVANVTHAYSSPGNFTILLDVRDVNGTHWTASQTIRVYADLAIGPSVSPLIADAPVSIHFDSHATGGAPTVVVTWNFSDGYSTHSSSGSHSLTTGGNYTVALVARDGAGQARFANYTVTVYGTLTVHSHLTPVVGILPLRVNGTGALTGGAPPLSPLWDFGVGPSGNFTQANASYTYTTAGVYSAQFSATDPLGGYGANDYTVNVLRPLQTFANASPANGVGPFAATFTANTVGGGGSFTYVWDFGDNSTNATGALADHTYLSLGTYRVDLFARDQYGFTANTSFLVHVVAPLNATLGSTGHIGVVPYTVHFTTVASGGYGNDSILWTFGDGGTASSGFNQSHQYTAFGTYAVHILVNDGIADHVSRSLTVQVVDPLAARMVVEPGSGPVGTTEVLTVTASEGLGPYTYAWSGLPPGCALGNVSGGACNSTTAGMYVVTVDVSDLLGEHLNESVSFQLTAVVAPAPQGGGSSGLGSGTLLVLLAVLAIAIAVGVYLLWWRNREGPPPPEISGTYGEPSGADEATPVDPWSGPPETP